MEKVYSPGENLTRRKQGILEISLMIIKLRPDSRLGRSAFIVKRKGILEMNAELLRQSLTENKARTMEKQILPL